MSKKKVVERFDCVEMKRRIQEAIYEETRGMKPEEFVAYIHKQVQESSFAGFFAAAGATVGAPTPVREGKPDYTAESD